MSQVAQEPMSRVHLHGPDVPSPPHAGPAAEHHGPSPIVRLISLLSAEQRDVWIVIIYAAAVGVLSLAVPLTAMAVVNSTALANLMQQLVVLCLVLFVCLALASMFRVLQTLVVEYLQRRIFVRVVADLTYRLPRVDITAFDQRHGPELVNRFFDVLTVQKAAATLLLDGIAVVLQTIIGLLLLAFYHQLLLGFDMILLTGLVVLVFVLGRGAVPSAIRESQAKYAVASWMEEIARNPATFKLNGGSEFARVKADLLARDYLHARQDHFQIVMRQFTFALALQALASTILLAIGGYLVINGQLTLGQLVAAEIVVSLVVASFTKLGKQLESFYDLLAAVEKLGHLTDLPLERQTGHELPTTTRGAAVTMSNVRYVYDPRLRPALNGLTLSIAPKERVALVGENGAGKSTIVDLLFGVRAATSGHIAIDGRDVRDLELAQLRRTVAVIKGLEIFDGSIFDNVCMGREHLTADDVRKALGDVGLLDSVLELPDGMWTHLRTGGGPLSLGQSERLMLARAIVGRPRLLILDESLDDMDPSIRSDVVPRILAQDAAWTVLVVTHCDEIASLCDRQIKLSAPRG